MYGKIEEDEDAGEEGETDAEEEYEEEADAGEDDESYIDFDTEVVFETVSKGKSYVTFEGAYVRVLLQASFFHFLPYLLSLCREARLL